MIHLGDITKIRGCVAPVVRECGGDRRKPSAARVPDGGYEETVWLDHFRGPTEMMV